MAALMLLRRSRTGSDRSPCCWESQEISNRRLVSVCDMSIVQLASDARAFLLLSQLQVRGEPTQLLLRTSQRLFSLPHFFNRQGLFGHIANEPESLCLYVLSRAKP